MSIYKEVGIFKGLLRKHDFAKSSLILYQLRLSIPSTSNLVASRSSIKFISQATILWFMVVFV